ncbi:MAG: amidohydrolase [Acidimicrobiia bacterium]|nr:amidohydrolase [Acidimicrobiia bacterium]
MLPADAQIVSVDDHVVEPPNVWQDRLPQKYKELGPKNIRDNEGRDIWMFEDRPYFNVGLNAVAGKEKADYGLDPVSYDQMRKGCWDIKARVEDMDADGVYAQLSFPTFPGFAGSTFVNATDKDLAAACVSAWNDWMVDEWCAGAPGRQIPMALLPFWDVDKSVLEIERMAAKGTKAITFTEAPHNLGLPSFHTDHWDPMFAAAQAADLPLCLHFGSGGAPATAPGGPFTAAIALFAINSQFASVELMNSTIFDRFPNLKFALSEGGIGWMPYILERVDYVWERHRLYTGMENSQKPSEIFRKHIFGCFISDEAGVANVALIGEDNVMFESDYPHSDSNWPHARKMLEETLAHTPDDVARKIAEDNARKLFNFPRLA